MVAARAPEDVRERSHLKAHKQEAPQDEERRTIMRVGGGRVAFALLEPRTRKAQAQDGEEAAPCSRLDVDEVAHMLLRAPLDVL
jgi:hypothetical protein